MTNTHHKAGVLEGAGHSGPKAVTRRNLTNTYSRGQSRAGGENSIHAQGVRISKMIQAAQPLTLDEVNFAIERLTTQIEDRTYGPHISEPEIKSAISALEQLKS